MKFSIIPLVAALYLFSSVEADISTTNPYNGVEWDGGKPETITWVDDGNAPTFAEITGPVTVQLMAGGSQNQVFVANIGTTFAVAKQIDYNVPKDVGPPGSFYFIKYTAGDHSAFSGNFTIKNVNGAIPGFDPNNPNGATTSSAPPVSTLAAPTQSSSPYPGSAPSTGTGAGSGAGAGPYGPAATPQDTSSGNTPASNTSAGLTSLPSEISSDVNNLVPSFASVATAVIALTFTYLY